MNEYGRARQATDDNLIRRMRFVCWLNKATDTHLGYAIIIASLPSTLAKTVLLTRLNVPFISTLLLLLFFHPHWDAMYNGQILLLGRTNMEFSVMHAACRLVCVRRIE